MGKYEKLIEELYARHQSVQTAGFNSDSYKPGLERMESLSAQMGYPSNDFRSIHVAGTNGKGSVCSMLASSLAASGLSVGLFTSPHLMDFRERVKIIGDDGFSLIGKDDVVEFVQSFNTDGLSFFEFTTGLAFWYFSKMQVDIAVIEVGLGGLLDSTNIIVPELSVVTSIGLDHCAVLGNTVAEIAGQKAGIFKPGVPALVGCCDDEVSFVFEAVASREHCPLFFAEDWDVPEIEGMDLRGDYQQENLRTVIAALDLLGEDVHEDAIAHAAVRTDLCGRWETVGTAPLTIADIGHNPPALKENFAQLDRMIASGKYSGLTIVYGIMADKDLAGIVPLMPRGADYIFVTPGTPRAMKAGKILDFFLSVRDRSSFGSAVALESFDQLPAALSETAAARSDSLVYVGGSTFVVADYVKLCKKCEKK